MGASAIAGVLRAPLRTGKRATAAASAALTTFCCGISIVLANGRYTREDDTEHGFAHGCSYRHRVGSAHAIRPHLLVFA
jgi:hypothetical protein